MEKKRKVEIISNLKKNRIDKDEIARFALDVMDKMNIFGSISIFFCGKKKIKELNNEFRQKEGYTDVISFPSGKNYFGDDFLGDVAICLDIAKENAFKYGISLDNEIKNLVVHSILHLSGYDHENDRGQMKRKENRILRELNLK